MMHARPFAAATATTSSTTATLRDTVTANYLAVVVGAPAEHTAVCHQGQVVEGTTRDGCDVDGAIHLPQAAQNKTRQAAA